MQPEKTDTNEGTLEEKEIAEAVGMARLDVAFSEARLIATLEKALGSGYGESIEYVKSLDDDQLVELAVKLCDHVRSKIDRLSKKSDDITTILYTALLKSKTYAKKLER